MDWNESDGSHRDVSEVAGRPNNALTLTMRAHSAFGVAVRMRAPGASQLNVELCEGEEVV